MPIAHMQKFLRHATLEMTSVYAESGMEIMLESETLTHLHFGFGAADCEPAFERQKYGCEYSYCGVEDQSAD